MMAAPAETTHGASGGPLPVKDTVLETGAALTQSFEPISGICAHLNAFHVYASDPQRCVEANHYCTHISEDVRQCLIYDTPSPNARLIGVEYMVTPRVYSTFSSEERRLWHSHVYEVKSGMLIMPTPKVLPNAAWEVAEAKEMEQVVGLYGKTYHFWQVDLGHTVPLGEPKLMMSFIGEEDAKIVKEQWEERDKRFEVDSGEKKRQREYIHEPEVHQDADSMWKK